MRLSFKIIKNQRGYVMNKVKFSLAVSLVAAVFAVATFTACGEKQATPCAEHSWDEGRVTAATCGEHGLITYTCTVCGEIKTDIYGAATGEHTYEGNVCTVCGYVDMTGLSEEEAFSSYGYYHIDDDGSHTVNTGDKIYFGSYPQTKVTQSELLEELNSAEAVWHSYGYYADGAVNDNLMSYADVTLNGTKYRGVKIEEYRSSRTDGSPEKNYISSNGYEQGFTYWFGYSAIEWRVLNYENGEVMLNAVKCIDSQAMINSVVKDGMVYYADAAMTAYSNNWEKSDIRAWLNGEFLTVAFTAEEQAKIVMQTLDNVNTGYSATSKYTAGQNDTQDKVYLLSYEDILNADYGYPVDKVTGSGHESILDLTVCKTGTDYADCQGLRTSAQSQNANGEACSWWMLRSAGGTSFSVCGVNKYGLLSKSNTTTFTDEDAVVVGTNSGISPAVNLKIGK